MKLSVDPEQGGRVLTLQDNSQEEMTRQFHAAMQKITREPAIQVLKSIPQHKGNTTFRHCVYVAQMAFRIALRMHWQIDAASLVRGAFLHDYYLYDTETMPYSDYQHAILHPKLALEKASKLFNLNEKEKNLILSHMWPIPFSPLPRCKEAWLVCLADKICAFREMHGKGSWTSCVK